MLLFAKSQFNMVTQEFRAALVRERFGNVLELDCCHYL
jgi:hypothetical protein